MSSSMPAKRDPVTEEMQYLVSQILHDFISHFTAISTGLDMPVHMAPEIFPMLLQSRQQLNAYLNVLRYMFSQGDGSDRQGTDMITAYGHTLGIVILGHSSSHRKIITGLTLWAMKQVHGKSNTTITRQEKSIHMQSLALKTQGLDTRVLFGQEPCTNPRDSFAAYVARLVEQEGVGLSIEFPSAQELFLTLHAREAP